MPDIDAIAQSLFGRKRAETQEVLTDATTRTYVGTAVRDSEDGTVLVDLGGDVTLPDDIDDLAEYSADGIEVATGPSVKAGDEVIVTVFGGSSLKTPVITGVAGEGDRQDAGISNAQTTADDAANAADVAWDWANDAYIAAGHAQDSADAAQRSADSAASAAETAWDWADDAHTAAETAWEHADDAKDAADAAQQSADEAEEHAQDALDSARTANTAANDALTQLSVVEDVIGTVDWVTEHGTYSPTHDVTVHPDKVYFTRSGSGTTQDPYLYSPVSEPKTSEISTYYELSIDAALSQYVASHLALTDAGLWVLKDGSSYKSLVANTGMSVVDPVGHTVVTYGPSTVFASDRAWYIGSDSAYIYYDGSGHIYIGGASVTFGSVDGIPIQQMVDAANEWSYDHNYTLESVQGTRDATAKQYVFTATVMHGGRDVSAELDPDWYVWYLRDDVNGDIPLDGTVLPEGSYSVSQDGRTLTISQSAAGYRSSIVGGLRPSADYEIIDENGVPLVDENGGAIIGHVIGDWTF